MVGTTLGKYRIEAEISHGGMGTIYRASQLESGQVVAVKVLRPALAADRVFLQRFRREVRALQHVQHPNIIEIYDVGSEGEVHYFAMEYLERSLAELLRGGPLAPPEALQIARQVAHGLEAAHAAGICHRDIKPGNILFAPDGGVKVTDFGIAKVGEATRMTQTGAIVGTPTYMAPEQAEGPSLDARADIYSLGVVLYEMTTGRPPFEGKGALEILRKHRFSLPEPPKSLNRALPTALSNFILHMLEKSAAKRPAAMALVANTLGRMERNLAAQPEEEPGAPELSPDEMARRYERAVGRIAFWGKRLVLLGAVILLAYVVYELAAPVWRDPADYLREAHALEASDAQEAIAAYEALIERFPDEPEAEEALARIDALRASQQRAKPSVIKFRPDHNTVILRARTAYEHFRRARSEVEKGRIEHAKQIFRMVRDRFPDTPWAARADARLHDLEAKTPPAPEPPPGSAATPR